VGDSLIVVFAIFLAVALMVIYPLLVLSENNESISQLAVQTITSEFVERVTTLGEIRETDFDIFIQRLYATGNTFDVRIEVSHLDENPSRRAVIMNPGQTTGNVSFSVFTSSILPHIQTEGGNGTYLLKRGDTVIVTVRNTNRTIAQLLRDFLYSVTGADYQVGASFSGTVVNNGRL